MLSLSLNSRGVLQLGASTYDAVAKAIAAVGTKQAASAADALDERLRLQGVAIDRILGLPDGSIAFVEPGFSRAVMGVRAKRGERFSRQDFIQGGPFLACAPGSDAR